VPADIQGNQTEFAGEFALELALPGKMILRPAVDEQNRRTMWFSSFAHM
jgi:hypothetical protein